MTEQRYRKGDAVRFQFGTRTVPGVVKDDRGPIGVRGRHLYVVEFQPDSTSEERKQTELPAALLELVQPAVATK